MKYDVIIIGAGPGGIFAAYELMQKNSSLKVAAFENVYDYTPTIPEYPDSPQTGDTSNPDMWIALMFISGGAALTLCVYDKKKRRQTNE